MEITKTYNSTRKSQFSGGLLQTPALFNHKRKKKRKKIKGEGERGNKKRHGEIKVKPECLQ